MSTPRTIRVALLICGQLSGLVYVANGGYYDVYRRFLINSLPPNANTTVEVDGFDVVNDMKYPEEERISEYDVVMLTGSAASAYENLEWINRLVTFVQHVANDHPKVKIYGICFGHQIVGRALGGKCVPNSGRWEIGPTTIQLTDLGKSMFGVDRLDIQQMHRDHVPLESLSGPFSSKELHLLGSTSISDNQGFVKYYPSENQDSNSLERIHIITLQGHPEFTESIVTGIIRQRSASGVIDAAAAQGYFGEKGDQGDAEPQNKEGTGRRWWKDDGVSIIGSVFWKILGVVST
ncbi:class I glutamine amidotransferase-like protein [Macrolepiota fuliginosa MF-IS2]|uniref:Class I glutamine amidotransferase-like protein n=1 Tax=Macrolepiota fuliginosa MF-IS2 TaxID=1400762 RepID=A0A9P6C767_9AGAR|nr:class I glutamine amidotransferase-like protein [Macrolepiota fuliginosa MF-IS2]